MRPLLFLIAVTAAAAAKPPKVQVPAAFHEPSDAGTPAAAVWWRAFHDPVLDRLVEETLARNLDLRVAFTRIEQARAAHGLSTAALLPEVNEDSQIQRLHGAGSSVGLIGLSSPVSQALQNDRSIYSTGLNLSWEADLFGRLRAQRRSAQADVAASQEDLRALHLSLAAQTAQLYLELRAAQQRRDLLGRVADADREAVDLIQARASAGLVPQQQTLLTRAQWRASQATLPPLDDTIRQRIYALSVLTGQEPGALLDTLASSTPPPTPPTVPAGLPSDLLRRRPDLRAAEYRLDSAVALTAEARAQRFPSISLTGSFGRQSSELTGLTLGASRFFSIGPAIRIPLFTGGRVRAQIELQTARQREAGLRYEQAMLQSLQEVDSALSALHRQRERAAGLRQQVEECTQNAGVAAALYRQGIQDYQSVLDANRRLFAAQDEAAQADAAVSSATVTLCKALGGGW